MPKLSRDRRTRRLYQITLKAAHNFATAALEIKALVIGLDKNDFVVLPALFLSAVIRYARPFTAIMTGDGKETLPLRPFVKDPTFSKDMHRHLMRLRDSLLAHDDLTETIPRINTKAVSIGEVSFVYEAEIRGKSLGYPMDHDSLERIRTHVVAARDIALAELDRIGEEVREHVFEPEDVQERSSSLVYDIPPNSQQTFRIPLPEDHEQLAAGKEPDLTELGMRYRYFEMLHRSRMVPATFTMPDGSIVELSDHAPSDLPAEPQNESAKRVRSEAPDKEKHSEDNTL